MRLWFSEVETSFQMRENAFSPAIRSRVYSSRENTDSGARHAPRALAVRGLSGSCWAVSTAVCPRTGCGGGCPCSPSRCRLQALGRDPGWGHPNSRLLPSVHPSPSVQGTRDGHQELSPSALAGGGAGPGRGGGPGAFGVRHGGLGNGPRRQLCASPRLASTPSPRPCGNTGVCRRSGPPEMPRPPWPGPHTRCPWSASRPV